jgi:predicted Rdx family selenoprotein
VADELVKTYIPADAAESQGTGLQKVLLWDRKAEGGFPGKLTSYQSVGETLTISRNKSVEATGQRSD